MKLYVGSSMWCRLVITTKKWFQSCKVDPQDNVRFLSLLYIQMIGYSFDIMRLRIKSIIYHKCHSTSEIFLNFLTWIPGDSCKFDWKIL